MANPVPPDGYRFNQSQRQAFYIFHWAVINADTLSSEGGHWIGAFHTFDETNGGLCNSISDQCPDVNNDDFLTSDAEFCVGSAQWNQSAYVSLPVMGSDSLIINGNQLCDETETCHYLNTGEFPTFKIYDTSLDSSLTAIPSSEEPFMDLEIYFVDLLEHESYLDYNSISLYEGNNLISFWALPWENSVEDIFGEMEHIVSIVSEGLIASYIDGVWLGNLETINRYSGYWVMVEQDEVLNVFGIATENNIVYNLEEYKNLISFPSPNQVSIIDAIPYEVENSFIGVIGQGNASQRINSNWEGTLTHFEGTHGYWALINEPVEFSFNIDESRSSNIYYNNDYGTIPDQFDYNISKKQAFYFIDSITIDNKPIELNQILLTFCNDQVVGSRIWNGNIIDQPAMGNDGTGKTIGYCNENQIPEFKLYNENEDILINLDSQSIPNWNNNTIFNINLFEGINHYLNPKGFSIEKPYPNPFNGNICINYTIKESDKYSVEIIDLNGRIVDIIKTKSFHLNGDYFYNWNANLNSSGTYFVKIINHSNHQNITQKLMLIK